MYIFVQKKIIDGGGTALYAAYTVDMAHTHAQTSQLNALGLKYSN